MRTTKVIVIVISMCLALSAAANAGPLEKRHGIGLQLGMWNQVTNSRTEVGIGSVTTSVKASGFFGGLSYDHWLEENLALNVVIGGMLADVETNTNIIGTTTEVAVVAPILFGVKFYFPKSTFSSSARPYVKATVGSFIGQQEKTEEDIFGVIVESRSESAFGGQVGIGTDFILSRYFMLGVAFKYNLMTDFKEPIGGSKNYGGPEFSFGMSFLFGKGTEY
ncbi:MAG: outer membrane beta-barrel protein [candidate division Zixibacteria bacterium]